MPHLELNCVQVGLMKLRFCLVVYFCTRVLPEGALYVAVLHTVDFPRSCWHSFIFREQSGIQKHSGQCHKVWETQGFRFLQFYG